MRLAFLAIVAVSMPSPDHALAAPAKGRRAATAVSAQCKQLSADYVHDIDLVGRLRALNAAVGDSGRASLRAQYQQQEANALSRAQLGLQFLQSARCTIPPVAPDAKRYEGHANRCHISLIMERYDRSADPGADCNVERWEKGQATPGSQVKN